MGSEESVYASVVSAVVGPPPIETSSNGEVLYNTKLALMKCWRK